MQSTPETVEVAIPLPLEQTFHYRVPETMNGAVPVGMRVLVPFGRRTLTGYVIATGQGSFSGETREIIELLDREPLFAQQHIDFYRWIAAYYLHPLGEVIRTALPAGLTVVGRRKAVTAADGSVVSEEVLVKGISFRQEDFYLPANKTAPLSLKGKAATILQFLQQRGGAAASLLRTEFGSCRQQLQRLAELGLVSSEKREFYRSPFHCDPSEKDCPHLLNSEQQAALDSFTAAVAGGRFSPFLLHGVTGSGKTEVYLQAIAHALDLGKTALVLVPEIALTPQLVGRFRRRFSCGIAVLHSGLSAGERYDEWRRIIRGEAAIVIGARSAIFAPLSNLGIIVVDEEHEATYKQAEGLRYNARDLALVLGKQRAAVVILGSATPLLTTVHAARTGKIVELVLGRRVNDRPMPVTTLLDLRGRKSVTLSPELIAALGENLASGGQALLFLNRRGFATWLVCRDCGHILRCPNCSVTLTYHQQKRRHICHYCDYSIPAPSVCPACDGGEIGLFGAGTEKLEEEVAALFPEARIARMDRDTTRGKGGHARVLKLVEKGEIDILIGTQMIAKGHDFPGVTIVGVISPDTTLNLPDFRGGERAFQLVSQVLGRAGRGDTPGTVLVQTMNPDHFALRAAVAHDYEAFYREELAQRLDAGYPPFAYLAALHFSGNSLPMVEDEARKVAAVVRGIKNREGLRLEILGPAVAPLGRIRGRHRWHILLKSAQRSALHVALKQVKVLHAPAATVRMAVDIDPLEML
jgi:primosomal protein N' (replication factor Y)